MYKATGAVVGALRKVLGIDIRVTGTENLVCRPTLFVPNHFTRVETFLVPHVIFDYAGRQTRSLGTHSVFKGLFGRYFESLGGLSTRHPRRNRTIIRELMTWRHDWVIYPEGGLIKNKKTVDRGKLQLSHPERSGPPHTGAAMLALKAEMCKRRYLDACDGDDLRRIEYYEEAYGLNGPDEICQLGVVMQPVTLTFYPMRPSRNIVNRLAKLVVRDLDPRIDEELTVEGSLLLKGAEVCVHFGEPIEVAEYLGKVIGLARRVAGLFNEENHTDLFLRKQSRKLTEACCRAIYANLEVSFDHLFSFGLRAYEGERIQVDDLRASLFLAASELNANDTVRMHPSMRNGISALVTGAAYEPWDKAVELATREGVIRLEDDAFVLDHEALKADHDFHTIRLEKMIQVLANEIEPVEPAVTAVSKSVNLEDKELRKRTSDALHHREVRRFHDDYHESYHPDESKPKDLGEPYMLTAKGAKTGVVLAHGYLASPEQMRPLAESLHARGLTVYAVRLPGHGTAPEQLTSVRWQQWLDAMLRGHALVRQHCDHVILGGFSLGAVLAMLAAARQPDAVDGVVSINAPMKLRDRRVPFVGLLLKWHATLRGLGLRKGHYRIENESESPEINYSVDYVRSVRELKRAVRACNRTVGRISVPTLLLQADHDPVVDPESGRYLLRKLASQNKILTTLPFDRHLIIRGEDTGTVFESIGRFIQRLANDGEEGRPPATPAANPAA